MCRVRVMVYMAGGERETDEPPPFFYYVHTGLQVFRGILMYLGSF